MSLPNAQMEYGKRFFASSDLVTHPDVERFRARIFYEAG